MNAKLIGGILLVVGTSIGAGMLALPVANASVGFWQSSLVLILCWLLMTSGALFLLEVNLYLPKGNNMVSMAGATLGKTGQSIAWFAYLILLYTLLSAYISGGSDVFGHIFSLTHIKFKEWQSSMLFTGFFGAIVYAGIKYVDYTNRLLMFGKLGVYLLLVILIAPYIKPVHFHHGSIKNFGSILMILITSFGFAIIIPSLRDYFDDDIPSLRRAIVIGSLIPLFCYIAWDSVIIGALPDRGTHNLESLINSEHTTSDLSEMLTTTVQSPIISQLFNFFTSVCMLTAFLGVSLCLFGFLSDGLKLKQSGRQGIFLMGLTFVPPLVLVLRFPGIYIQALAYAGIACVVLLLLLPAMMVIVGRKKFKHHWQVPGGQYLPILTCLLSLFILAYSALPLIF